MYKFIEKLDTGIRWSFYTLFFLTPLVMWSDTFELFEFNKMWVVFGISLFIFFLWGTKMIAGKQVRIRRTPLDIPIVLFLISQIISTFISMEPHTSLWGYYSRFNGGLFSMITYIFLYYAFATNLIPEHNPDAKDEEKQPTASYKALLVCFLSGLVVTLWGLPSHFGYDFTCLVFRGALDTKCWTAQFQPQIRIFSTLGQPNWMGTYLAALLPIMIGFGIKEIFERPAQLRKPAIYLGAIFLVFWAVLYTRSQSSFLGLCVGLLIFAAIFAFDKIKQKKEFKTDKPLKYALIVLLILAVTSFLVRTPIGTLNKFVTLEGVTSFLQSKTAKPAADSKGSATPELQGLNANADIRIGGSDSGDIRKVVWKGAIEIFKQNPLFGTGVETYAFAYYKVKPVEHNLYSEWDFLYNKAHNEYLNYLATTGIFGLGTYLLLIVFFLFKAFMLIFKKAKKSDIPVLLGIVAGYVAMAISNFFGFSVVIVNLFFFLFPIFFFEIADAKVVGNSLTLPKREPSNKHLGMGQMIAIFVLGIVFLYFESYLANFWFADRQYALGYNLNKIGEFTQAYTPLSNATKVLPGEDIYKDEQSINLATIAVLLMQNNRATEAAQLATQAKDLSDQIIAAHPNNIVFYKTRIRVQYALAQLDPGFIDQAIESANRARKLAPTDAKLTYNLALFYNQKGDNKKMLELLDEAIKLRPNYFDPFYARALLYKQLAQEEPAKATEYRNEARKNAEYILKNIDPNSGQAKELLKSL